MESQALGKVNYVQTWCNFNTLFLSCFALSLLLELNSSLA